MPTEQIDEEIGRSLEPILYAGFWPRLASLSLDGFIIITPIVSLAIWMGFRMPTPHSFAFSDPFVGFLFALFYEVYLVRQWGATPGKLIMGLRILKINGEPIGYREALLRAAPFLIFGLFDSIASHYRAIPDRAKLAPSWYGARQIASAVWLCGEVIVLLTNCKRRALHDFIAGTVVVIFHRRQVTAQSKVAIPGS